MAETASGRICTATAICRASCARSAAQGRASGSSTRPEGFTSSHRSGDSVVVIEAAESFPPTNSKASVYVHVDDVDAAQKRAIEMGATSTAPAEDKPYQERACGVKDNFGNTW